MGQSSKIIQPTPNAAKRDNSFAAKINTPTKNVMPFSQNYAGGQRSIYASKRDRQQHTDDQSNKSKEGQSPVKTQEPTSKASKQHRSRQAELILIPPPPPAVPVAGVTNGGSLSLAPLTLAELKARQADLNKELAAVRKHVEQVEKHADDKRQRSTLFATLYTEGVVSRRELEAAQKEDSDAQTDLSSVKNHLDSLRKEIDETDSTLTRLAKSAPGKGFKTSQPGAKLSEEKK